MQRGACSRAGARPRVRRGTGRAEQTARWGRSSRGGRAACTCGGTAEPLSSAHATQAALGEACQSMLCVRAPGMPLRPRASSGPNEPSVMRNRSHAEHCRRSGLLGRSRVAASEPGAKRVLGRVANGLRQPTTELAVQAGNRQLQPRRRWLLVLPRRKCSAWDRLRMTEGLSGPRSARGRRGMPGARRHSIDWHASPSAACVAWVELLGSAVPPQVQAARPPRGPRPRQAVCSARPVPRRTRGRAPARMHSPERPSHAESTYVTAARTFGRSTRLPRRHRSRRRSSGRACR